VPDEQTGTVPDEHAGSVVAQTHGLRLRRVAAEEYEQVALPWYQDPEVLRFSEGGEPPYDRARVRRMYDALSTQGELYLVELREPGGWRAIGDAALLPDDVPIVIGRPEHRSRGLGGEVLQLLVCRARALGWTELHVGAIDPANIRSRRMFERAGFVATPRAPADNPSGPIMTLRLRDP
jgi:RimJ/RimL family protein N-acetyltransferase